MNKHFFDKFLASTDTLRVYDGDRVIFRSDRDRLLPLLDYIDEFSHYQRDVEIFDKIIGNAAALLVARTTCKKVYSLLGSELAIETLRRHRIDYYFTQIMPYIQNATGTDMCPMEKLSIGKNPDEFYEVLTQLPHFEVGNQVKIFFAPSRILRPKSVSNVMTEQKGM